MPCSLERVGSLLVKLHAIEPRFDVAPDVPDERARMCALSQIVIVYLDSLLFCSLSTDDTLRVHL